MTALSGFPLVNQNNEPTMDGHPDENAPNNCVVADLAAILEYYHPGKTYDGDEIKDAVYGQGYTGPMDPAHFVAYMQSQGVAWKETTGEPLALELAAHAYVAAGKPVLLQIPSAWNDDPPPETGSTHAVVACKEDAGSLTCMNPWGGFWHYGSDSYWQARIRYGSIWFAEAITMGVPNGWRDDGTTLTAPNGVGVVLGFRQHILNAPVWPAALVPLAREAGDTGGDSQPFGLKLHFDSAAGTVVEEAGTQADDSATVAALQAQVASLQAQLAQAQKALDLVAALRAVLAA